MKNITGEIIFLNLWIGKSMNNFSLHRAEIKFEDVLLTHD